MFEAKVEVGAPDEGSLRIAFCGDEILLRTEGESPAVTLEPHELHGDPVELLWVARPDGVDCWLVVDGVVRVAARASAEPDAE